MAIMYLLQQTRMEIGTGISQHLNMQLRQMQLFKNTEVPSSNEIQGITYVSLQDVNEMVFSVRFRCRQAAHISDPLSSNKYLGSYYGVFVIISQRTSTFSKNPKTPKKEHLTRLPSVPFL